MAGRKPRCWIEEDAFEAAREPGGLSLWQAIRYRWRVMRAPRCPDPGCPFCHV